MKNIKFKFILGCSILLFASFQCNAAQLTPLQALNRALKYKSSYLKDTAVDGKEEDKDAFTLIGTGTHDGRNTYYAMTSAKRTIIIAADNQFKPILGILDYPLDSLSHAAPGMIDLLDGITGGIRECNNTQEDLYFNEAAIKNAAPKPLRVRNPIAPLIATHWHQCAPYNQETPTYTISVNPPVSEHYVTGCVPTAVAQILYYHRHPAHLLGQGELFIDGAKIKNVRLDNNPNFEIKWDSILPSYEKDCYDSNNAKAVANLLYGVGLALKTNYCRNGSSTSVSNAGQSFIVHFNRYSLVNHIQRSDAAFKNNSTAWEDTLYKEIANRRPVLFAGNKNKESIGHAFILDGYRQAADGRNYFHMNYGWGGESDGEFTLTADSAKPTEYTVLQEAIIGIMLPPQPTAPTPDQVGHVSENDGINPISALPISPDIQTSKLRYFTLEGIEIQSPLQPGCYIQKSKSGSKMIVIK